MIIYENTKRGFINDVKGGAIAKKIQEEFASHGISHKNEAEYRAWNNSLMYMQNILDDDAIPDDITVAVEYQIPLTSKRVDFMIIGEDDSGRNNVIIIELKQWNDSSETSRFGIVTAFTGGANRTVVHPCYQAYSYAKMIETFNENVDSCNINIRPCAYLHNYKETNRSHIDNDRYAEAISLAPVFLEEDVEKLKSFIKTYVKKKDKIDILSKLDIGKLKPAKSLQDSLASMINGNHEFVLLDEQKVAYETVYKLVSDSVKNSNSPIKNFQKSVVIVSGGSGTGKSIVAIQLLADLIQKGYSANYVTKNATPRKVYFEKMKQENYKSDYIRNLFKSSDYFWNSSKNVLDCIIVDEAHRLRKKSSFFYGENQIKEIINAGKVTVFFVDHDQKVTVKDIGSKEEIRKWAEYHNAEVYEGDELELVSQFRCNGSDGYINFLDNMLEIRETANQNFDFDYDIRLYACPVKMREALREKIK